MSPAAQATGATDEAAATTKAAIGAGSGDAPARADAATTPRIRAQAVCVNLGATCALHDLDLEAQGGGFIGVVGPNGGGKTTFLRALLGLVPLAHGSVTVEGRVAYVPQHAVHVDAHVPIGVGEFVGLGRLDRRFWRRPRAEDRRRVQEAMQELGVWDLRGRRLSRLSGGQRQRVHLAKALCQDAQVLLLDEPTTGVDPDSRHHLHQFLRHLAQDHGMLILTVSHDTEALAAAADRIVVIDGTKRFDGDPDAFRAWSAQGAPPPAENPFGKHVGGAP